MKVISDFMEAYSEHIGLPLYLTNLYGEIELKVDRNQSSLPIDCSISSFIELKNVAKQLNNPTIISALEKSTQSTIHYMITPIFSVNNVKNFLVAGPFLIESKINKCVLNQKEKHLIIFNDKDIEEKMEYMKNLYQLLISKGEVDISFSVPEQIISVLDKLESICCNLHDDGYIFCLFDEVLQILAIDFFGVAVRNEDDIFVIKHVSGEKVQHLVDKGFYIGEGLLGKAVILGKDFYWSKKMDCKRAEFFNRFGIFPHHLFGFTLKKDEIVNVVIFGGSFKKNLKISEIFTSIALIKSDDSKY